MATVDIIIGVDGIIINDLKDSKRYQWKDIIGISRFKSIIFLIDGKMIESENLNFIRMHDYGQNRIGEGQPEVYNSWRIIFPILRKSIKTWGNIYLPEFETLYTSFYTLMPENLNLEFVLSEEERRDRKNFIYLALSFFCSIFFTFFVQFVFFDGKQLSIPIGIVIAIIFFSLLIWIGIFIFRYNRESKINKIFERHKLTIAENIGGHCGSPFKNI